MREISKNIKPSIFKKIFIKMCRFLGFEIIDQNTFTVSTSNKFVGETISTPGVNSINIPLGKVEITRKVESLDIIIRTCSSVKMLTQNKERIFGKEKIEYTLRSINSIINSVLESINIFKKINFKITIVDHNSSLENLGRIKSLISSSNIDYNIINLDMKEFERKIERKNQKKELVKFNQLSNMSNIYKSFEISKSFSDLIYFVEDDYLHKKEAVKEILFAYERISSQVKDEIIICPIDYPYLYTKAETTYIFLGENFHWRKINETLCTFLTSKKMIQKNWDKFISICKFEHYPFEKPLHDIYQKEMCISPVPSLAVHCTNINSIFGVSPNIDIKKIWEENEIKKGPGGEPGP